MIESPKYPYFFIFFFLFLFPFFFCYLIRSLVVATAVSAGSHGRTRVPYLLARMAAKKNQDALLNVYYVRSKRIPSAELLQAGMMIFRFSMDYAYRLATQIYQPYLLSTRLCTSTWPLGPKLGCPDARNPFIFLKSGRALSQTTIPSPLSHCVPLCALSVRSREI